MNDNNNNNIHGKFFINISLSIKIGGSMNGSWNGVIGWKATILRDPFSKREHNYYYLFKQNSID